MEALSPAGDLRAHVRIMVEDVDHWWKVASDVGLEIHSPIADRDYGLRDFILLDPDGMGLRFASRLAS